MSQQQQQLQQQQCSKYENAEKCRNNINNNHNNNTHFFIPWPLIVPTEVKKPLTCYLFLCQEYKIIKFPWNE